MQGSIVTTLTENAILTLFIVIGLGYLLGEISLFGFRFGIVGVLFVGLGFAHRCRCLERANDMRHSAM